MADQRETDLLRHLTPLGQAHELLIEDVKVVSAGKKSVLRITVDLPDGPGSVDSEKLTELSRDISSYLDEHDPLPGTYTLEVTTAGATRTLSTPRHFRRTEGHEIEFVHDGTKLLGRVIDASDEDQTVTLRIDEDDVVLPIEQVRKARIRLAL